MQNAGVTPRSLHQKWQFAIEIGGFDAAFFTYASEVAPTADETSFDPAGSMSPQKLPGRIKWDDVTLRKGILQEGEDDAAILWLRDVYDVAAGKKKNPSSYLKDADLVMYDGEGTEIRRTRLYGAWPKKVTLSPELEGASSDNSIEEIVLAYQRADRVS